MKKKFSILLVIFGLPFLANAQPPEERAPIIPLVEQPAMPDVSSPSLPQPMPLESQPFTIQPPTPSEVVAPIEISPSPVASPIQVQPVAEPIPSTAISKPQEDNTVKGVSVGISLLALPIGYDSIGVGGPEGGRYYFSLQPSVDINSSFKTNTGKTVSFNINYTFFWREYYNKATTTRDFENDVYGALSRDWNDQVSSTFDVLFVHFFKAGEDLNADNSIVIESAPTLKYKVNPSWTLKTGYWFKFVDMIDSWMSPDDINIDSDLPSDIDEIRNATSSAGLNGIYGPYDFYGTSFYSTSFSSGEKQTAWFANHTMVVGTSYKVSPETSVGLDYKYVFYTSANDDGNRWKGHYIVPSISQKMPWKGGTISLKDELRLRFYDYAVVGSGEAKRDWRNRISVSIDQEISEYMKFSAFYRLELSKNNKPDALIDPLHALYTGISFGF